MAAGGAPPRQLRRGPAPIASFDHDGSDESSPDTRQAARLPEIREDPGGRSLAPPEPRARSHSSPAVAEAPRIDISRASSSSHHDSRDSSPELALFAGGGERARLGLGFREDGALELRSSTEELAFLEAPGERPAPRRPGRKDSQGSEAALLAVSGRTSRLSSVGSQCSAHSAHSAVSAFSHASHVSRLSVVSGVSRSPSPHRMLLETSFCGPKPIETDPEICAAAVEERLLEIAKLGADSPAGAAPAPVDARDRREVRTEATVERASRPPPPSPQPASAPASAPALASPSPTMSSAGPEPPAAPLPSVTAAVIAPVTPNDEKLKKENQNRARVQERRARPRVRREPSEPEVYKSGNRTKDIIRIKLKPDNEYEETEEDITSGRSIINEGGDQAAQKPASLELTLHGDRAVRPTELVGRAEPAAASPLARSRAPRDSRTPSPAGVPVSRKSSFCSLFKSRETIASPDSPSDALRRKRSLTEGRSRSKSRDRSATPSSAGKIRGSVLSLFRTPRKSGTSPSPSSREGSPVVHQQRAIAPVTQPPAGQRRGEKLKYYDDTRDGIIHIPLRTPPDERPGSSGTRREPEHGTGEAPAHRDVQRPASAPHARPGPDRDVALPSATQKPVHRTVLPDGSIIIPLRSPTERTSEERSPGPTSTGSATPSAQRPIESEPERRSPSVASVTSAGPGPAVCARPADCAPEAAPNAEHVDSAPTAVDDGRRRRKERILFTTHVGSREQVFSTQFSITKTPSVTSEISGSFPSFVDPEEPRASGARDARVADGATPGSDASEGAPAAARAASPASPRDAARDSSESEPSSESAPARGGNDVERRGLVVQESFEDELPYVPTTLPQERSVALPMVPVRERGGVRLAGVQRPRAAPAPPPPAPAPRPARPATCPAAPAGASAERLRIRLPRRPRTASVAGVGEAAPAPRVERARTRSGGDESRPKTEWIDFEEVPERRKQPKRIQTLPAPGAAVLLSYVEPEHCRCECHAAATATASSPTPECGAAARPFAPDLELSAEEARPH